MRLIEVKQSGKGIKQGDVVKYGGNYYLATGEADSDGDVYVVDAEQDTAYISEGRLTKVVSAGKELEHPVVTIEMTVKELTALVVAAGVVSVDQLERDLRYNGHAIALSNYGRSNYETLLDILKEVAKK